MIQWLTRDWGLKLLSFVLAIGLWYYAVGEEGIEVTRNIPLEVKLENPQMSILKKATEAVQVTLVAPRALLPDLTSGKIQASHTIASDVKTAGDYTFRLEPREISLPSQQIRVTKIEPEVIRVTLDELMVKKVKIKPYFVGEPAFGYQVTKDEIQMDPNAILIEGPKGQLEKLDAVPTERIDLVGRIRSFRRTVALDLPANVKALSEALIDIFIPIKEEAEEKPFQNVPVKVLSASKENYHVELFPPIISFSLKGPRRQLDRLIPERMLAYVDVSSLAPGEHDVPVTIPLSEGVALAQAGPVVKVTVKK